MMTLNDPRRERILDLELVRDNQLKGIHKMRMTLLLEMHWHPFGGKPEFCKNLHMELLSFEEQLTKELADIRRQLYEGSSES